MSEKIKINLPIIVEGKYDKCTLSSIFDATIISTGGFGIFNSEEKRALVKKLGEKGIIVLTDSDGGGKQIRSYLSGILPKDRIFHLYIPEIEGKERRKKTASKAGLLGVEGMTREVLERVFEPFISHGACQENVKSENARMLTKLDFFTDGLSGGADSSKKREKLARALGFPHDMSANALIEAINLTVGYGGYIKARDGIFKSES